MLIGEVARRTGVSPDTVRHYERRGLLPAAPRGDGGFRIYGPEAVRRVLLVRRALAFGFTLTELRGYLKSRDAGHAPCRQVRAAALEKLGAVETQLRQLRELRGAMKRVLARWDASLASAREGVALRLLDDLPSLSTSSSIPPGTLRGSRHANDTRTHNVPSRSRRRDRRTAAAGPPASPGAE